MCLDLLGQVAVCFQTHFSIDWPGENGQVEVGKGKGRGKGKKRTRDDTGGDGQGEGQETQESKKKELGQVMKKLYEIKTGYASAHSQSSSIQHMIETDASWSWITQVPEYKNLVEKDDAISACLRQKQFWMDVIMMESNHDINKTWKAEDIVAQHRASGNNMYKDSTTLKEAGDTILRMVKCRPSDTWQKAK